MTVDKEAYQFILLADGSISLEEILKCIYEDDYLISVKREDINNFVENLKKNNLFFNPNNQVQKSTIINNKKQLENITINTTKKCNLRCKHCFIKEYESNDTLSIESLKKFVQEGMNRNYLSKDFNLAILGGEPLLEKHKVIEIAKFGRELKKSVIVSTNGLLIDSNFAKKASEFQLEVQVSLEGAKKETNDQVRGKGTFEKVKEKIRVLVSNNVYTIISMVVHEDNYEEIEDLYHFGKDIGIDEIRYIPLKRMGQAKNNLKPISRKKLLYLIYNLVKKDPSIKKYLGRDFYSIMAKTCAYCSKTSYCGTGLKTILIDSDGEVYPCPNHNWLEFKSGNIHNNTFEEIWVNSPILNKIRTIYNVNTINNECSNCVVKHWCAGGCRGEAYENTNDLTSKAVECEDIRESIIETFWILSNEDYSNYSKQREYF